MRKHLYVQVGGLVPAGTLSAERPLEAAAGVEQQHRPVSPILRGSAERGIGGVREPRVGLAAAPRLRPPQSPDAKMIAGAAVYGEVQIPKVDLPNAKRGSEIIVKRRAALGGFADLNIGVAGFAASRVQCSGRHRSQVRLAPAKIEPDVLIEVAEKALVIPAPPHVATNRPRGVVQVDLRQTPVDDQNRIRAECGKAQQNSECAIQIKSLTQCPIPPQSIDSFAGYRKR